MGAIGTFPQQLADWHEGRSSLRMLVAALGAFFVTTVVHLPQTPHRQKALPQR